MKRITHLTAVSIALFLSLHLNGQDYIRIDASFNSETLGETRFMDIFLPNDYYANPDQEYAVIYYLHGMNGDQNSGNNPAAFYYDNYLNNGTHIFPPAIIACPDASCEPYLGSYYMNSELYGNFEDYIMEDVIGFVESHFRAKPDKNFRLITGWSMGGWGAGKFAVKYPDHFRASAPCIGYLSMPDTMMSYWRDACYGENGSYSLNYSAGGRTKQYFTACGGLSPNLNKPDSIDIPFDTTGAWIDSVLDKWYAEDPSTKVKDLPGEDELTWFLLCGTQDEIKAYPTYQVFMDSLNQYGIGYETCFFSGGHVFDAESWIQACDWFDSIIETSYLTVGINSTMSMGNSATVYPNPCSDAFTMDWISNTPGPATVDVFDQSGKHMISAPLESPGAFHRTCTIDMSHYPAGLYFVRVKSGDARISRKVVKN